MGTACSSNITLAKDHQDISSIHSNGSTSTNTTTTKTIQSPSVWNPFYITRMEAEDLLKTSEPGSFIFSRDMTSSELFLSLSVGKYVCHHSVVTRDNSYFVGAKRFDTIGDVVSYFRDHPLGGITLKDEYKRPIINAPNIQVKPHPDVLIQSSTTASTSEVSTSEIESRNPTVTFTQLTNHIPSPALRRHPNQRAPVERIEEEDYDANGTTALVDQNNIKNKTTSSSLRLPQNKVAPLPRKPLVRSEAIDQDHQESSSSGAEREVPSSISLMPLIPQQDYAIRSSPLIS